MTGLAARVPDLPQEVELPDPRVLAETDDLSRAGAAFFWPGVSPDVAKRALGCAPSPCSSFLEGAFLRGTLGQLSPVDTDDAFWALGNQTCDAKMMGLIRHAPPRSSEAALELLQTMSQLPLERLFGKDAQPHINRKHHGGANKLTVRPQRSLPQEENTKS